MNSIFGALSSAAAQLDMNPPVNDHSFVDSVQTQTLQLESVYQRLTNRQVKLNTISPIFCFSTSLFIYNYNSVYT